MKTINYTGNSKLISRIVHLLNRKAPLPLDGDGDADWGTNGQVLTTDGSGATYWSNGGGSGDTVTWNQIQSGGTQIAEIDINGTSTNVYAPSPVTYTEGDGIDITSDVISLEYFSVVNGAVNLTFDE